MNVESRMQGLSDGQIDVLIGQLQAERARRRRWRRKVGVAAGRRPIYRTEGNVQIVTCLACTREFERPRQRGQVPRRCPACIEIDAHVQPSPRAVAPAPPTGARVVNIGQIRTPLEPHPDAFADACREAIGTLTTRKHA